MNNIFHYLQLVKTTKNRRVERESESYRVSQTILLVSGKAPARYRVKRTKYLRNNLTYTV